MSRACFLCGAHEVSPESHHGSALCADCLPANQHVVSERGNGRTHVALCQCGWRTTTKGRYPAHNAKVRLHWRDMIRRHHEQFDAEFGEGAAWRDTIACLEFAVLLTWSVVGLGSLAMVQL